MVKAKNFCNISVKPGYLGAKKKDFSTLQLDYGRDIRYAVLDNEAALALIEELQNSIEHNLHTTKSIV
jgi:hypothetical protein